MQAGASAPFHIVTSSLITVGARPHPPRALLMLSTVASAAIPNLPGCITVPAVSVIRPRGCRSWATSTRLPLGLPTPSVSMTFIPPNATPRNNAPPEVLNPLPGAGGPFNGVGLGTVPTAPRLQCLTWCSPTAIGHPFPLLGETVRLPSADEDHAHRPGRDYDGVVATPSSADYTAYLKQHPRPVAFATIPDGSISLVKPNANQASDGVVPLGTAYHHASPYSGFSYAWFGRLTLPPRRLSHWDVSSSPRHAILATPVAITLHQQTPVAENVFLFSRVELSTNAVSIRGFHCFHLVALGGVAMLPIVFAVSLPWVLPPSIPLLSGLRSALMLGDDPFNVALEAAADFESLLLLAHPFEPISSIPVESSLAVNRASSDFFPRDLIPGLPGVQAFRHTL